MAKLINGVPHVRIVYTTSCTGCCELGEMGGLAENYPYDEKARCRVGMGCSECGYTGKRRHDFWMPENPFPEDGALNGK